MRRQRREKMREKGEGEGRKKKRQKEGRSGRGSDEEGRKVIFMEREIVTPASFLTCKKNILSVSLPPLSVPLYFFSSFSLFLSLPFCQCTESITIFLESIFLSVTQPIRWSRVVLLSPSSSLCFFFSLFLPISVENRDREKNKKNKKDSIAWNFIPRDMYPRDSSFLLSDSFLRLTFGDRHTWFEDRKKEKKERASYLLKVKEMRKKWSKEKEKSWLINCWQMESGDVARRKRKLFPLFLSLPLFYRLLTLLVLRKNFRLE